MLVRELVKRHLPEGAAIAVAADPSYHGDLDRVGPWKAAEELGDDVPGVVVVDLGEGPDLQAPLQRWATRWPTAPVVVLLLRTPLHEVPVGTVVDAARAADLHFVEALPVQGLGPYRVGVVAAREPAAPRGYVTGEQGELTPAATARIAWEWGLDGLVSRALTARGDQAVAGLQEQLAASQAEVASLREQLAEEGRAHAQAVRELRSQVAGAERKLGQVRTSASFVLGSDLVGLRRQPVGGTRRLVGDVVRMWRGRQARRGAGA